MKKVFILLFLLFNIKCYGQYESNLDVGAAQLRLDINMESYHMMGDNFNISIVLSSEDEIKVFDLETGYLEFTLLKLEGNESYVPMRYHGAAYSGGNYRIMTYEVDYGGFEHVYEELQQNIVALTQSQPLTRTFVYTSLFGCYPTSGKYKLQVGYEGLVKSEKEFQVAFNYEKTVTRMLEYLQSSFYCGESSTLNMNYYLLAYPEEKRYYGPDSLHYKQAPVLRAWWEGHKELILKVESVLNQEQYKDLLYEERIPKLLKKLERGEHQERLEARNELYEILSKPEWEPTSSDTEEEMAQVKELSNWWEENKQLINWVNRVILENQL
jgi:hypothetical protein